MNAKTIFRSKTFWVQVVTVIATLFPGVREWVAANPESAATTLAAVNVLVRFITSGKVTLLDK